MDDWTAGCMINLKATNYAIWKPRMEDLLYCKDLYEPLENDGVKPTNKSDAQWNKMNRKTIGLIRSWIDQSVFHHVATETKAYALWHKLESMYERKTAQNKAFLIRKLVNSKFKDGNSVAEHLSDFQSLINQLSTMKMVIDDEMQALLLLSSLPDSWETLVVSLSNSAPNGKLTMDTVKDSLFNEEQRRRDTMVISAESQVFVAQSRGKNKGRNSPEDDKSRGRSRDRKEVICFHCQKPGHIRRECRFLKKEQSKEKDEDKDSIVYLSDVDVAIVCDDKPKCHVNDWIIDSGASFHATSRGEIFTSYSSGDFGHVRMGNGSASKIIGIGDICLETNSGCRLMLREVRHVPDIRFNLISAGKLDENGYKSYFGEGQWKLTKGSLVVTRGKKVNTLYTMRAHMRGVEDGGVRQKKVWYKAVRDGRKALHENHERKALRFKWVPKVKKESDSSQPVYKAVVNEFGKQKSVKFELDPPIEKNHADETKPDMKIFENSKKIELSQNFVGINSE